uniref:Serine/threonine-protein kinase LMTK3 n=1 Tax=Lygus hesperus TaxID=30085 RepID=A0A0A9YM91_LYGHE
MSAWYFLLGFAAIFDLSAGHPIDPRESLGSAGAEIISLTLVGVAFLLITIFSIVLCACCRERNDGFKEFSNPGSVSNVGFTNALATEVAIFPPPGADVSSSLHEPILLPPVGHAPSKPAAFSSAVPDVSDWFVDANTNFPRQQLFYQKEIGKGWFGKVVEGEARGAKVIVRILREDATPEEKAYFLHEAKPYRDLRHKNVCRLFGRCLEIDPYLLLFELQNNDLKNFLVVNSGSRRAITEQGISLKLMTDVCEGLKFMNDNGFIHTDLAARNCLVTSDLTVKIGDYGTSIDIYKNEYYIAGDVAVPIRWCAPETLHCTPTTIETKQVTTQANVWSAAVLLWEIAEFGRLPYDNLSDDQVIVRVFGDEEYRLLEPDCPFGQYLYNIMQICWRSSETRATIEQVLSMLRYLKTNPFQESDFEARWKKLKPNTVPVVDNHTPIHSPRHTELAQRPRLPNKSEFDSGVDLEIKPTDENQDSCKTSSPMTISPQLSVTSEEIFQTSQKKSPSLTNLQGSFEDLTQFDSWLQGVEQKTEEDRKFVRNISEAIKNLDETLALEKTSSSSADSSIEGPKKPLLDFKLGPLAGERKSESSSDTEEETWRHRVERGEFTEKVKEKSKSVTDLMVLTHIDSEESENDSLPSLTKQYSLKRSGPKGTTYTSIGFGSEGNIRNAVLSEELQEKLKSFTIWKPETSFLGTASSRTPESPGTSKNSPEQDPFLGKSFSEASHPLLESSPSDVKLFLENEVLAASRDVETEVEIENEEKKSFLVEAASENNNSQQQVIQIRGSTASVCAESEVEEIVHKVCENVNSTHESVHKEDVKVNSSSEHDSHQAQLPEAALSSFISIESQSPVLSSSHPDNCVPKIVITESELFCPEAEPEINEETQHLVEVKPRKFVFVCRDDDVDDFSDKSDFFQNSALECKADEVVEEAVEESSVILGSCEEHTLDFFKGLKTTFSPVDYSDDEDKDWPPSPSSANDECLEDEHTSESTVVALRGLSDKSTLDELSGLSVHHSCDDNTETFESSPTNSDTYFLLNTSSDPSTDVQPKTTENHVVNDKPVHSDMTSPVKIDSPTDEIPPSTLITDFSTEINEHHNESLKDSGCELLVNGKVDSLSSSELAKQELTTDDSYSELNSSSSHDSPVYTREVTKSSVSNNLEVNPSLILKKTHVTIPGKSTSNKVSKSKSLESVLCAKGDLDAFKPLGVVREAIPVFSMVEMVTEDVFPNNSSFDSYFSVDSGHSSDRCMGPDRTADQDKQMNDLKNRLEDVMKCNDDYQLRNSEDEYGGKLLTPDDERSSDSGFRDKGSLSESVEDTCDEKYNLEDIDAELDDYGLKTVEKEEIKYYNNIDFTPEAEPVKLSNHSMDGWFLHSKADEGAGMKESGWVSLSTEDDVRQVVTLDDEFVAAIRSELAEKLPCAQYPQKVEEEPVPEQEIIEPVVQFTYPAQLSPILEEQESNQSSLVLDDMSPILLLPPPEINIDAFREDIIKALEADESPDNDSLILQDLEDGGELGFSSDKFAGDDDVLLIDTETNEATIVESPKPQSHLAFVLTRKTPENFKDDDSTGINSETYIISPAETYVVSPDNHPLTPDISLGSNTLSSPENCNMSGMYMSPCSIRSDLFDSGPPSLPFDLGQSLEEVEDICVGKSNNEAAEIVQDLIDAGIVNRGDVMVDDLSVKEDDISNSSTIEPVYTNDEVVEEPHPIATDLVDIESEYEVDENLASKVDVPQSKDTTDSIPHDPVDQDSSPAHTSMTKPASATSPVTEGPPVIVVEEESPKHKKAELEIDLLLGKSEGTDVVDMVENKTHTEENKQDQNIWLKQLLLSTSDSGSKESVSEEVIAKQGWPTNDELLSPSASEDKPISLKPSLNSTLALMSPDLSSTDSKSHSLLSSFSSTPTYEDTKLFVDGIKERTPTSLSIGTSTMPAPMPSPEDAEKGWRPTICQLMELTDQAEGEEMTTSFIEPDENGIYTPDWDSDTSDEQSSSSGEFVWKLQEPIKMERIDEEEEDNQEGSESEDDSSSEGSGTEFVPSTWNAMATPSKSSIKSPDNSATKSEHKRVIFKKEKYQCIYEYPREPSDDEESPDPWQTPNSSVFDYSTFADWELGDVEPAATTAEGDNSDNEDQKKPKKPQDYDFYRLNYNMGPHLITEDGEFFISSSSRAFEWSEGDSNEFFPGRVTDDMEFVPGAAELTPLSLGELRHTKDSLRLELPVISRNPDKAEASFLDSGIDTASPPQEKQ